MSIALRRWTVCCALLLAVATAANTADSDADELFNKARVKVLDNTRRLPRYTCVETVSRSQYLPADNPSDCQSLVTMQRLVPTRGSLMEHDKLRLDVAFVEDGEIFSWAGAGKFETSDVGNLTGGGASGSGEFGSFLASVFGSAPDAIRYTGLSQNLARFEYNVPLAKSNYHFRAIGPQRTVGYRGTFSVNPADADLRQLVVEADQFTPADGVCRVRHEMDYTRVKIGAGEFLLPQVSTMDALYSNGGETLNETRYSDCREYVGESTIHFDDIDATNGTAASKAALQPLPPKVHLLIGLSKPIPTETAAAGDAVDGALLRDVTDSKLGTIASVNDRVHGRILRLQQWMGPPPRWYVAIRFDTIERNAIQQAVSLKPIDDGDRSGQRVRGAPLSRQAMARPEGAGVFVFTGSGNIVLDQNFHSEWETR
jgi:hypothetical protein